jgi:superfamily II RNA helicase
MLKVKTGPAVPPENPSLTFPYQTDDFQNHSFNAIESGDHVLVTAHTGSGKTTVAEYAVAYGLLKKKKVIYTAPIKALSNQIFGDFQTKYPAWNVGIKTGDIDYKSDTCDVLIMTTEIVRNMLFKDPTSLSDVSVVIFDEVHWIKDSSRGTVWEESIIMMPEWIQMIMLSATLPDAEQFCTWIAGCKKRDVSYTTTTKRVVPLSHYLMNSDGMSLVMDNDYNFNSDIYRNFKFDFRPPKINEYTRKLDLPALFFCFSKKNCERYAKAITLSLVDSWTSTTISNEFHRMLRKFDESYIGMPQTHEVLNLLSKGVGYHHAGLLPPLKEIVQELFSRGLIQVLFVTETFAAGVNMPAKTVVFTGFSKTNGDGTYRTLLPEEYGQMAGRAGRRGKDVKGTVILLPFNPDRDVLSVDDARKMMSGAINSIKSRFKIDYSYLLKTVHSSGGTSLMNNLDQSLLTKQDNEEVGHLINQRDKLVLELDKCGNVSDAAQRALRFDKAFKDHMLSKKDLKTYQTEIRKWISEHTEEFNNASKEGLLKDKIRGLNGNISAYQGSHIHVLNGLAKFLFKMGYIVDSNIWDGDVLSLTKEHLTIKGIMAMEVNECNPLMLTELVHGSYLDTLSFQDIISVLALFLDVSGEDRTIDWNPSAGSVATKFLRAMDTFEVEESKSSSIITEWSTNDYLCDLSRLWVEGAGTDGERGLGLPPMLEKLGITDMHPGEFVRMMLKLDNICKEVTALAQICGKDHLLKTLEGHYRFIIRNIVTPQSLYVQM